MSIRDDLKALQAAEEFFAELGVGYEPAILTMSRRHILQRLGLDPFETDSVEAACRPALGQV